MYMNESQLGESQKNVGDVSQKHTESWEKMVAENHRVTRCGSHEKEVVKKELREQAAKYGVYVKQFLEGKMSK